MTRLQIMFNTILIATDPKNSDTQLRQGKDGFYTTSLNTGNHFIPSNGEITERVKLHWEGFKKNQPEYQNN